VVWFREYFLLLQPNQISLFMNTKPSPPLPARAKPAHESPKHFFNNTPLLFITVCAHNRKPVFASPKAHASIVQAWSEATYWSVGRYVCMPDHIHFFCTPAVWKYPAITTWIKYWKSLVSKKWPQKSDQPLWQRDFWDTQLRRQESYRYKWDYVRNNPVRAGLVNHADAWPYQGELHPIEWIGDYIKNKKY